MLAILLLKMPSSKGIICTLYFVLVVWNHANCLKDPEFQTTKLPISHLPTRRVTSAHLIFPKKTKAWSPGPQLPAQSGSASPPRPSWQSFEISVHWARGAEIHGFNLSQFRNPNSEEDFQMEKNIAITQIPQQQTLFDSLKTAYFSGETSAYSATSA